MDSESRLAEVETLADGVRAQPQAAEEPSDAAAAPQRARQRTLYGEGRDLLRLQRRHRAMVTQHLQRALVRVLVLVTADLASVYLARAAARTLVVTEGVVGTVAAQLFPVQLLEGWQYATALVPSLLLFGAYAPGDHRRDPRRLLGGVALAGGLSLWAVLWSLGPARVVAEYVVLSVVMGMALVLERKLVDLATLRFLPDRRVVSSRAVILGTRADRDRILGSQAFQPPSELKVVGWVDVANAPDPTALGGMRTLGSILAECQVESVIVAASVDSRAVAEVGDVAMAAGCELFLMPRGIELPGARPQLVWSRGSPLLRLTAPSTVGWQLVVKRALDVAGAAFGLVMASPLFVAIAVAVKLDSRGPVFFSQERVGQGGRRFRIFKFRTMVVGAEQLRESLAEKSVYRDGRLFKVPDDPRTTKVGRFLRRTSLDELPQLWNAIRGEMSLVGPRPPIPSEVDLYQRHHYARFEMKPGLTGPWQVAGRNEITDFEQVVALEAAYIRRWSLFEDLLMILRTVPVVLRRHGAY